TDDDRHTDQAVGEGTDPAAASAPARGLGGLSGPPCLRCGCERGVVGGDTRPKADGHVLAIGWWGQGKGGEVGPGPVGWWRGRVRQTEAFQARPYGLSGIVARYSQQLQQLCRSRPCGRV